MTDADTDTETKTGTETVHKVFDSYTKADQSGKTREATSIVSVFDTPDRIDDIVRKGAFLDALDGYGNGKTMPVIWTHQHRDLFAYVGEVKDAEELKAGDSRLPEKIRDHGGLHILSTYDDDPHAQKCFMMLKGGRVSQWSFGFGIDEAGFITYEGKTYRELTKLDIFEVGPTIRGMHSDTATTGTKSGLFIPQEKSTPVAVVATPVNDAGDFEARMRLLDL